MCTSIIHAAFNVVLLASMGLLLASLLTPAWQHLEPKQGQGDTSTSIPDAVMSRGVLMKNCVVKIEACATNIWEDLQAYEKITAALLIVSLAACLLALVWSCVMFFACCCKSCLVAPLPLLCTIALLLNVGAILVYTLQEAKGIDAFVQGFKQLGTGIEDFKAQYGYSMYLAVIGGIGLVIDIGLGIALLCCAKTSPV